MSDYYDLAIVGGGPAGAAAAVYAARKRLRTLLVTAEWGGQSVVSERIENWIGTVAISGADLARNLRAHVEHYAGDCVTIVSPTRAASASPKDASVAISLEDGSVHEAKALLIATGSNRRKLDVPGSDTYENRGLTYCASCDGPLFAGKDVTVVGGGNAAFETALQLLAYCKTVTLLNRTDVLRADEVTVSAAAGHPAMRIVKNATPTGIEGGPPAGGFVTGLRYRDATTGAETLLPVDGVFVEIGLIPNTQWLDGVVARNAIGQVIVDPRTQRAFLPSDADGLLPASRVWAAGDCTDGLYHQNNIAAGDAVKALEDIYIALRRADR